mmetsp:Transcript_16206/g.32317  ORF Transcript_16206/g.32317 Transcript_16206/m.32317 type:complete len:324 (+) Transcript_16206:464-1435(+)
MPSFCLPKGSSTEALLEALPPKPHAGDPGLAALMWRSHDRHLDSPALSADNFTASSLSRFSRSFSRSLSRFAAFLSSTSPCSPKACFSKPSMTTTRRLLSASTRCAAKTSLSSALLFTFKAVHIFSSALRFPSSSSALRATSANAFSASFLRRFSASSSPAKETPPPLFDFVNRCATAVTTASGFMWRLAGLLGLLGLLSSSPAKKSGMFCLKSCCCSKAMASLNSLAVFTCSSPCCLSCPEVSRPSSSSAATLSPVSSPSNNNSFRDASRAASANRVASSLPGSASAGNTTTLGFRSLSSTKRLNRPLRMPKSFESGGAGSF